MFKQLATLSLLALALAAPQHQQAAKYPAGVNPQDCPNFPICDNARLHNPHAQWQQPAQQWNAPAAPQWNQWNAAPAAWEDDGQWKPEPVNQWADNGQWNAHADNGQWNPAPAAPQWNAGPAAAPAGHAVAEKYPAGVNPQTCPNYPYCDINAGHGGAAAPPLPGFTERQYPAGVSPHTCPNFPYCA